MKAAPCPRKLGGRNPDQHVFQLFGSTAARLKFQQQRFGVCYPEAGLSERLGSHVVAVIAQHYTFPDSQQVA